MTTKPILQSAILLISFSALAAAGFAQDRKGRLNTLPHGQYICSLPGDAGGAAWTEISDKSFAIENASTYRTQSGAGIYLLTGKRVTFTRGPMKGWRFERTGTAKLQQIDQNGALGRMRCIRRGGTG